MNTKSNVRGLRHFLSALRTPLRRAVAAVAAAVARHVVVDKKQANGAHIHVRKYERHSTPSSKAIRWSGRLDNTCTPTECEFTVIAQSPVRHLPHPPPVFRSVWLDNAR